MGARGGGGLYARSEAGGLDVLSLLVVDKSEYMVRSHIVIHFQCAVDWCWVSCT